MKRRITKIGHPLDCYHCGQLVEYPAPHFEASPGTGQDMEQFCSNACWILSCQLKEGKTTVTDSPSRPRADAHVTIRTNIARAKADRSVKRREAIAHRKDVIRNALNRPKS